MTDDQKAILKRIRRKAEILLFDLRAQGATGKVEDCREILALIDLMENQE